MARPEIWADHIACRATARLLSGKPSGKAWEAHARGGSMVPLREERSGLTALRDHDSRSEQPIWAPISWWAWEAKPTSNAVAGPKTGRAAAGIYEKPPSPDIS